MRVDLYARPEDIVKRTIERPLGMLITLAIVIAACSLGDGIEVEDAYGRPSPTVAAAGAFFMTIANTGTVDDRLLGGSSPACGTVELHESAMTDAGAMEMHPVGVIEIPAGGEAVLEPGGLHVMCIDKLVDFAAGAQLELTLEFEQAGEVPVEVEIREP